MFSEHPGAKMQKSVEKKQRVLHDKSKKRARNLCCSLFFALFRSKKAQANGRADDDKSIHCAKSSR